MFQDRKWMNNHHKNYDKWFLQPISILRDVIFQFSQHKATYVQKVDLVALEKLLEPLVEFEAHELCPSGLAGLFGLGRSPVGWMAVPSLVHRGAVVVHVGIQLHVSVIQSINTSASNQGCKDLATFIKQYNKCLFQWHKRQDLKYFQMCSESSKKIAQMSGHHLIREQSSAQLRIWYLECTTSIK